MCGSGICVDDTRRAKRWNFPKVGIYGTFEGRCRNIGALKSGFRLGTWSGDARPGSRAFPKGLLLLLQRPLYRCIYTGQFQDTLTLILFFFSSSQAGRGALVRSLAAVRAQTIVRILEESILERILESGRYIFGDCACTLGEESESAVVGLLI